MAKSSGLGTIVGLGVAGVGVWWVGNMFGWWGGTASTATTGTTPGTTTTTPTASVTLASSVSPTANNALQATFLINGASEEIAVIPNGDAFNNSGEDITTALAAEGVTPAQLYAMMSAAYTPPAAAPVVISTPAVVTTPTTNPAPVLSRLSNIAIRRGAVNPQPPVGRAGMGAMVYATRVNYVRKGSNF